MGTSFRESRSPLVLVIDDQPWMARRLGERFGKEGWEFRSAPSAGEGIDLARRVRPDALVVRRDLPDRRGEEAIDAIRRLPLLRGAVPAVLRLGAPLPSRERQAAIGRGAWGMLNVDGDLTELMLLLGNFLGRPGREGARCEGVFRDPRTGFWSGHGLVRRTEELLLDCARDGRPIACIRVGIGSARAAGPDGAIGGDGDTPGLPDAPEPEGCEALAAALRIKARGSDAVGRLRPGEFAWVASGADEVGTMRILDRLLNELVRDPELPPDAILRAGMTVVPEPLAAALPPGELLAAAEREVREVPRQAMLTDSLSIP